MDVMFAAVMALNAYSSQSQLLVTSLILKGT